MFTLNWNNHKKIHREEFRLKSKKRFNFLHKKHAKRHLNVHEALSFKREKTPIAK